MKIKLSDLGKVGYCHRGARLFCKQHGFNWHEFRTTGIDEEKALATGDAMVIALVEKLRGK